MKGHIERVRDQHRLSRSQAYAIGSLVLVAFNDPKKFPKAKDFLEEKQRKVIKTLEEQRAFLSQFKRMN